VLQRLRTGESIRLFIELPGESRIYIGIMHSGNHKG
jgi:hypothetical protein